MAMDTNRNCNLCGGCVKFCQHGALRLTLRRPGAELWQLKRPLTGEALFVLTLMAIAFVEVMQTTQLFPNYMKWALERNILASYDVIFSLTLLGLVALTIGSYLFASYLSSRLSGSGSGLNLASFGYGFIPLALAGYLGVAVLRLANQGGRAIQVAINQLSFSLAPFELPPPVRGSFYSVDPSVKAVQFLILATGTLSALWILWKIAKRRSQAETWAVALPYVALMLVFSATFGYIFFLPSGIILH
jgi:ferredoxin